jgi:hypothetical protein
LPCSFKTSGATSAVYKPVKNSLDTCNISHLLNELDHGTCLKFGTGLAEFLKGNKPGIRVAKNTVTVSEEYAGQVGQEDVLIHTLGRLDRLGAFSKGIL